MKKPSIQVVLLSEPHEGLMIGSDFKSNAVEVGPEMFCGPHYGQKFFFRCGIVRFRIIQGSGCVCDGVFFLIFDFLG